jgi:hypothetical protein
MDSCGIEFKSDYKYHEALVGAAPEEMYDEDRQRCCDEWLHVVRQYSMTALTNAADKLIASLLRLTLGEYAAGLWRWDIERQLLWQRDELPDPVAGYTSPSTYRAPSWSWASIDGPVWFVRLYEESEIQIQVLDVTLQFETEDTTGQVRSGYLDLRGYLKPLKFTLASEPSSSPFDTLTMVLDGYEGLVMGSFDKLPHNRDGIIDDVERGVLYHMQSHYDECELISVMLRVVDWEAGIFERIGMMTNRVSFADTPCEFRAAFNEEIDEERREMMPCLSCEDGLHTIRVV